MHCIWGTLSAVSRRWLHVVDAKRQCSGGGGRIGGGVPGAHGARARCRHTISTGSAGVGVGVGVGGGDYLRNESPTPRNFPTQNPHRPV